MTVPPVSFTAVMAVVAVVICDACAGRRGPTSNLTTLRANGTEFLLSDEAISPVRSRRGGLPENRQKRAYESRPADESQRATRASSEPSRCGDGA
jgi:hypothetical protein